MRYCPNCKKEFAESECKFFGEMNRIKGMLYCPVCKSATERRIIPFDLDSILCITCKYSEYDESCAEWVQCSNPDSEYYYKYVDEDFSCPKADTYDNDKKYNIRLYIPTKEEISKRRTALEEITNIAKELSSFGIGLGWAGLLLPIIKEIDKFNKENNSDIEINQIKEKYGSLRIYLSHAPDYLFDMIEKAEDESEHICEECGKRGENKDINGWYSTLCDEHYEKRQKERAERFKDNT